MTPARSRRRALATLLAVGLAAGAPLAAPGPAVARDRADLTVTRTTAPATATTGKAFRVETGIRNAGLGRSAATTVRYYLSTDQRRDRGDRALGGSARLKSLIGGTSWDVGARVTVPKGTAPGRYYVLACVEADAGPARNDCKAPSRRTRVLSLAGDGSIAGELTLRDVGETSSESGTSAWDRTATVGIRIDVDGDSYDATFADDGSRYTYTGEEHRDGTGECPTFWDRAETGEGGFVSTGDPFTDEIHGGFTRVDRSGLRIGLFVHYDAATTYGDCDASHEQATEALNVVSIEFDEVARTATSVTYRAVDWEAELGTSSNWDTIEGTITFALD
ncbi:CARDB domain-containing protein [Nocardioides panacisoli]|uniref:CARDB domain-containing protein n=1 Tax=Nocardioides panacisoli TaxID=627624 RepID=A0ABP7IIQ6_9ACTN